MFLRQLFSGGDRDPIKLGVVDKAQNQLSISFTSLLDQDNTFDVVEGLETDLSTQLIDGELIAIVEIPEKFDYENQLGKLNLILDASQVRQLDGIKDSIEKTLLSIERELRGNEAMFSLEIVDMKARPQRYIDFLIPGSPIVICGDLYVESKASVPLALVHTFPDSCLYIRDRVVLISAFPSNI